jgi:hypothetical protein
MYSQPIYQAIEAGLRCKWPQLMARRSKRMPVRMVYRSINVVVGGAEPVCACLLRWTTIIVSVWLLLKPASGCHALL